jgi:hypothetical protein
MILNGYTNFMSEWIYNIKIKNYTHIPISFINVSPSCLILILYRWNLENLKIKYELKLSKENRNEKNNWY